MDSCFKQGAVADKKSLVLGKIGGLWFAGVCDVNLWDATQEEMVDVMSDELRKPDPRDLRRVSGEQVCSLRTCEVLAACGTFVGLNR